MTENTEEFSMNKNDGSITVIKMLDRETITEYNFTVVATNDCTNPPATLDDVWANSTLALKIIVSFINNPSNVFFLH